jgi:hypothetical protein
MAFDSRRHHFSWSPRDHLLIARKGLAFSHKQPEYDVLSWRKHLLRTFGTQFA